MARIMLLENACCSSAGAVSSRQFMPNDPLVLSLWVGSLVLQSGLVAVLLGKKLVSKFPFFGAYSVFTLLTSGILYLVREPETYFYVYWVSEGVGVILGFAVVYEVFRKLLVPYPALRRLAFLIFQWSVLVLVLLGCIVIYAQSSAEQSKLAAGVMIVEEATRIIEVGLLMFLFLFSTAFGLHWRQSVFGMALGLGIFATVELVSITMRSYWGVTVNHALSLVRSTAFNISLMVWVGYLLAPEAETVETEVPHRAQLEQWNRALTEFIHQ
jgi:hypothetical protein